MWRLRRFTLIAAFALLGVALAGAAYQALGMRAEARRFPEPGRLVDIGGYRLKINCAGQGSPTVILESGLGDGLDEWRRVQPEIARFTRVCSYDRAGYGGSDAGPAPRTSATSTGELHALLRRAGEKPPYLLVGHSIGGYHVRVFNGHYPDEVSALVLVDSTQEDQYELLPGAWRSISAAMQKRYQSQSRWAPLYVGLGIARLQLRMQGVQGPYRMLQSKYLHARAQELQEIRTSAEQARASNHIAGKPLIVLTGGARPDALLQGGLSASELQEYQRVWIDDLQLRLARLSARGKRVILPDSGHDVPADRPDAIVSAVRELL